MNPQPRFGELAIADRRGLAPTLGQTAEPPGGYASSLYRRLLDDQKRRLNQRLAAAEVKAVRPSPTKARHKSELPPSPR